MSELSLKTRLMELFRWQDSSPRLPRTSSALPALLPAAFPADISIQALLPAASTAETSVQACHTDSCMPLLCVSTAQSKHACRLPCERQRSICLARARDVCRHVLSACACLHRLVCDVMTPAGGGLWVGLVRVVWCIMLGWESWWLKLLSRAVMHVCPPS